MRQEQVVPAYIASISSAFPDMRPHHLVVDAGNGSMWEAAPSALRRAGQRVEELYCTPDGTFPNRNPNPAIASYLGDLCQRVVQGGPSWAWPMTAMGTGSSLWTSAGACSPPIVRWCSLRGTSWPVTRVAAWSMT